MVYTSYFAKLKKIPSNIIPISICAKAPDWYDGLQYKKLAPKYDILMKYKEDHDENNYIQCFYKQVLGCLSVSDVINELKQMSSSTDIVLLCYEKPSEFCHRHLVADWFKINGYDCEEMDL